MKKADFPPSLQDMILIYLLPYSKYEYKRYAPFEISEEGIARALCTSRGGFLGQILREFEKKNILHRRLRAIEGSSRKRKVYFLTDKGKAWAEDIMDRLENKLVTISKFNGDIESIALGKVLTYFDPKITLIELLNALRKIQKGETFDLSKVKENINRKRSRFVDYTDKAPELRYFFGREGELKTIEEWMRDETCKILIIKGIAGMGKTSLLAKAILSYKKEVHAFWHYIYKWSTLRDLIVNLSEFLTELGKNRLKTYLSLKKSVDIAEISAILEEDLREIRALLIFDDYHNTKEHVRDFFKALQRIVQFIKGVKIVVMGREIKPFYDRRDVVVKKNVREIQLEGLDRDSSDELLRYRGIPQSSHEDIYRFTKGHPLSLELIDSTDIPSKKDITQFVREEIFSRLEEKEKRILETSSVFRYPVEASALFFVEERNGISQKETYPYEGFSQEIIDQLVEKSLLRLSNEGYSLHDLLKEILYDRLKSKYKKKLHSYVAKYYASQTEDMARIEEMHHLINAGEQDLAAKLLAKFGPGLINKGFLEEISRILNEFDVSNLSEKHNLNQSLFRGDISKIKGEWDEALGYFRQALALSKRLKDTSKQVVLNQKIGNTLTERGEFDLALKSFENSIALSQKMNDMHGIGEACYGFGRVYWLKGEYDKSIEYLSKCLEYATEAEDLSTLESAYVGLGLVNNGKGEYEQAINHFTKALKLAEKAMDLIEVARVYNNLSTSYYWMGDSEKALENIQKCIAIAEDTGNAVVKARGLHTAGDVYTLKPDFEKAAECLDSAQKICETIGDRLGAAHIYKSYGILYRKRKDWSKSAEYFKNARKMFDDLGIPYFVANVNFEFGLMYKDKGDKKNAKKHLERALKIWEKLENKMRVKEIKGILDEI